MVGRKKASSSTAKFTNQPTLLDLFTKKSIPVAAIPAVVSEHLPLTAPNDDVQDPNIIWVSSSPDPVASTSKAAKTINVVADAPPKPPPRRTEPNKPTSSRSVKPFSSGNSILPDPIVIDLTIQAESPPASTTQPKPTPKPTHHMFLPRPKVDGPLLSNTAASTSALPQNSKQTYPMFNIQRKNPSGRVSSNKPSVPAKESDAPFPTKDSQHIRGPQTVFSTSTHWNHFAKKGNKAPPEHFRARLNESDASEKRTLSRLPATSFWEKEKCIESIPSDHKRDHPAIARLAASITSPPDASSSSEKLWSDRWRPQRADGVLGNEHNAIYLRDWLRALEVRFDNPPSLDSGKRRKGKAPEESRSAKRPQVMRSVARAKKRQRRSSDEFIVSDASDYSSEVEGPVDIDGGDDDDFQPAADEPSLDTNGFWDILANTIILTGPSGSGKSAAVYACAEELGWEVFEVYPGIGKRNGASLETLIGEVGKNHLVRRTQAKGASGRGRGEEVDADNSDDFGFITQKLKAGIRQSVILLDEVDIVFKEDANFWPGLIRIIKDCKRAVICTCNDLSLIPTIELPLQTILNFQPCPPAIAGSYLQGLCCAEGHIVDRDVLTKMYANGNDLRHTIHRLQLLCQGFPLGFRPELDHLLDWNVASRQSVPHADLISFMDAHMTRDSLDRPKASYGRPLLLLFRADPTPGTRVDAIQSRSRRRTGVPHPSRRARRRVRHV
ncbi:P-loop containing nucleoside triphosphate hydrolase protein [Mycena epipterygia]|nr:P-loop containing nucleoside triphosphate hydrolase protein [Mycena epipterygia]